MPKVNKDCLDEALRGLINFSKEDLENYVGQVFKKAKGYDNLRNAAAFDQAIKEINDERLQSYFEDIRHTTNNIIRFRDNSNNIKTKGRTMRDELIARNRPGANLEDNATAYQQAEYNQFARRILDPFDQVETHILTEGKLDENILDVADGKETQDTFLKKAAKVIKDYFDFRNTEMVTSDTMKFEDINEDRGFRAIHDQTKVITAGKSLAKLAGDKVVKPYSYKENMVAWRDFIKTKLNILDTFEHTDAVDLNGQLDMKKADEILETIYSNITTGKSDIFTRSVVANDREAVANRSRMFFKWKDLRSQYDYNKSFGRGNLFQMLMRDANASANKIGLTKKFGTNPHAMYNDLRAVQESVNPKGSFWWRNTDNYFNAVAQQDKLDVAPKLTGFIANTKMVISMARLPLLALDSISDIGYMASFCQRIGIDYYEAHLNQLKHMFDTFPNEDRAMIAKVMRTQVDNHLGYMGRWAQENNVSAMINKISTQFFKRNLMEAFDRGAKISNMSLMAKKLAQESGKKLSELNPYMEKYIRKFLTDHEWDLLRKKNQQGLFTTENVDSLSSEELKDFHAKSDSDRPLNWMKDDLYRKVHSMFVINSENTVLNPTNFERAWIGQGLQKGTVPEALWSLMTQFKYYPFAYIDRVLVGGWKDADTKSRKILWATSLMMGTVPLSLMSQFFKNMAMNKTMPDVSKMSIPEKEKYILETMLPALGTFGTVLDSGGSPAMRALKLLSSPSTTVAGNILASVQDAFGGNFKASAKDMANALAYVVPYKTTPVVSPIFENAMGQKAYLEPGQRKIFGS